MCWRCRLNKATEELSRVGFILEPVRRKPDKLLRAGEYPWSPKKGRDCIDVLAPQSMPFRIDEVEFVLSDADDRYLGTLVPVSGRVWFIMSGEELVRASDLGVKAATIAKAEGCELNAWDW